MSGLNSTFRADGYRDGFYADAENSSEAEALPGVPVLDSEYDEGFQSGIKDRAAVNSLKAFVLQNLDSDSISSTFDHVSDFLSWLEQLNAYEAMDQEGCDLPNGPSEDLLAVAYEELCKEEREAKASTKKSSGMRM